MPKLVPLEYIRGLAALCVALSHYLMLTSESPIYELSATLAVEVFFPLSGFVLAQQINYVIKNRRGYGIFLTRRWMRTLPPYILGLIAITLLLDESIDENFISYLFFFKYIFPSYSTSDYYPIAWSLAVEEWYYIVFPGLLLIVTKLIRVPLSPLLFAVAFFLLILITKILTNSLFDPAFLRIASFLRLDTICLGYIFFLLFMDRKHFFWELTILIVSFLLIYFFVSTNENSLSPNSFNVLLFFLLPISFSAAITLLAKLERNGKLHFRGPAKVIGLELGRISYSMYLFHLILIYALFPEGGVNQLLYFFLSLISFCLLFYRFFEKPIMGARPAYKDISP